MGGTSRNIDTAELITYSNNLVQILRGDKEFNCLKQCLQQFKTLQSQCDQDFDHVQKSIRDYLKKIDICKQKATAAESEGVADAELDLLQKELKDEQEREHTLREELRVIVNEINNLEKETTSVDEQRKIFKKFEQDELRAQMNLSMYASVTNIIPNLGDLIGVSGRILLKYSYHSFSAAAFGFYFISSALCGDCFSFNLMIIDIVERDKKIVNNFEIDPAQLTAFNTCNGIWKMINL